MAVVLLSIVIALMSFFSMKGFITDKFVISSLMTFDLLGVFFTGIVAVTLSRSLVSLYEASENALERLQRTESLKKRIVEFALDCIISIDDKGKIIEFNPAAEKSISDIQAKK